MSRKILAALVLCVSMTGCTALRAGSPPEVRPAGRPLADAGKAGGAMAGRVIQGAGKAAVMAGGAVVYGVNRTIIGVADGASAVRKTVTGETR